VTRPPPAPGVSTTDVGWRANAACAAGDPDLHHPDGEGRDYRAQVADAKAVCASCPVSASCREWITGYEAGFKVSARWSIWAGMTPAERHALDQKAGTKLDRRMRVDHGGREGTTPATVSQVRYLAGQGMTRSEIARALGLTARQVRRASDRARRDQEQGRSAVGQVA
jgi:WhiB family redox-sensing transcriptional regulator